MTIQSVTTGNQYPYSIDMLDTLVEQYPDDYFHIIDNDKILDTYRNHLGHAAKVVVKNNVVFEVIVNNE